MKYINRRTIIVVIGALLVGALSADTKDEGRKLPVGAYLKSAKIEILSGDLVRYQTAIAMLDSLAMHYGPHAEALHLMGQIMVDLIDKTPDPVARRPYLEKLTAYADSLHRCCTNKDIKANYKKDCDKYTVLTDSVMVKYWRENYNNAINQMNYIAELKQQVEAETDSLTIKALNDDIAANADSSLNNFLNAIIMDSVNYRSYVGLGSLYEKLGDFSKAIEWMDKGLNKTEGKTNLLIAIAYDYVRLDEYCKSIPYFNEYLSLQPQDTLTMTNLAICYNNCGLYDSARAINQQILEISPDNLDALGATGRFFNQNARNASDSATHYQAGKEETAKHWRQQRDVAFDSALVYFKRVTELNPNDIVAFEQYGTISALRGNFQEAVRSFSRLTELNSGNMDYWRFLGDCHLNLREFKEAIAAYEKVVETNPGELATWERLKDLYFETGNKTKHAAAEKKVKELQ